MSGRKLFSIQLGGDPYSRAWEAHEHENSLDDSICIYRGDISGRFGRDALIRYLRRTYAGCKIRVER